MNRLPERIAADMQMVCDEHFIIAVELACVSTPEYDTDPLSCRQRVRGALEELDPSDGLAEAAWD